MTSLSNQQKLFCQKYLELGMNGTQAYMTVYKNVKKEATARTNASRLLTNANIQEYIQELQSKVEDKAVVTIEKIVDELTAIAFADRTKITKMNQKKMTLESGNEVKYEDVEFALTDTLDENTKKAIAGYKKGKYGMSVETYDKIKALELLGKYLGMFKDEAPTINNNIVNPYANLSEEELRKLVGD